ncbi:YoaK family protein [Solicola sp. PLA-1-18]|uniref:YoaK family protein n=1 Tax=Solicola sp. PLA-1-18 TaxID=3380532 RepID=UPI003B762AFE
MSTAAQRLHASGPVHVPLMLALTFSTGVVDAVGYLGLDRVFTGNMTGNVVILGMALVGADDLPIVGPVLALVGFVLGAALGGFALRHRASGWSRRTSGLLAVVAVVLTALAVTLLVVPSFPEPLALSVTGVLGAAMGLQAATARHLAVADVTTVVVTSTLTGLAADSVLGNRSGTRQWRRLGAVGLILLGAAAGAALLRWELGAGVALSAAITIVVVVVGHVAMRRASAT